jgi:hypothetical protein
MFSYYNHRLVSFMSWMLYPRPEGPLYDHWISGWVDLTSSLCSVEKILDPTGTRTSYSSIVESVISLYTDCSIAAPETKL